MPATDVGLCGSSLYPLFVARISGYGDAGPEVSFRDVSFLRYRCDVLLFVLCASAPHDVHTMRLQV